MPIFIIFSDGLNTKGCNVYAFEARQPSLTSLYYLVLKETAQCVLVLKMHINVPRKNEWK